MTDKEALTIVALRGCPQCRRPVTLWYSGWGVHVGYDCEYHNVDFHISGPPEDRMEKLIKKMYNE